MRFNAAILATIIFFTPLCASANPPASSTIFSDEQIAGCLQYSAAVTAYYDMLKDGTPLAAIKELFATQLVAHKVSADTLDTLAEIIGEAERDEYVMGYFNASCLNEILNLHTPPFAYAKHEFKICGAFSETMATIDCAFEGTVRATKIYADEQAP